MVKISSKKIIKNSFFKMKKCILISYKVVLRTTFIFYYGNITDNFILFHLDLNNIKQKTKLKYKFFLIFSVLSRILKRIGFLPKLSTNLALLKK